MITMIAVTFLIWYSQDLRNIKNKLDCSSEQLIFQWILFCVVLRNPTHVLFYAVV